MSLTEHTFTFMLRNSGDVLAEVEHTDIVLRRRDGADLFLGLRSREIHANPELGQLLRAEHPGPPIRLRRPKAS